METLENLMKDLKTAENVKQYLLANIEYNEFILKCEKDKLLSEKYNPIKIIENVRYYTIVIETLHKIKNDLDYLRIKKL